MRSRFVRNLLRPREHRPWLTCIRPTNQYPELEKIEKENVDLIRERQLTLSRRRLDDDSDDLALCLGVPYNDPASNKSSIGDPSAPSDAEERNARRANRASRVSQPGLNPTEEGYLSDSALPDADTADYMAARSELRDRLQTVLGDVGAEDFRDPEVGLAKRFALWQQEYGEDYQGAYGGIAMVQAWEFWARWEMGDWDPLDVSVARATNSGVCLTSFFPVQQDARLLLLLPGALCILTAPSAAKRIHFR